jgi:hypothetical protein
MTANGDALNADWKIIGIEPGTQVQIFDRLVSEVSIGVSKSDLV